MIKISSLSEDWTEINAHELNGLKFVNDCGQQLEPISMKNINFRTPPIVEYRFDGFLIQVENDFISEQINARILTTNR